METSVFVTEGVFVCKKTLHLTKIYSYLESLITKICSYLESHIEKDGRKPSVFLLNQIFVA